MGRSSGGKCLILRQVWRGRTYRSIAIFNACCAGLLFTQCNTLCNSIEGFLHDGKIRKTRRIPAEATHARSAADLPRNRENYRREAAAEGATSTRVVEQQSLQQRHDQGLAQCRLQERAGGHGSAQADVSPDRQGQRSKRWLRRGESEALRHQGWPASASRRTKGHHLRAAGR